MNVSGGNHELEEIKTNQIVKENSIGINGNWSKTDLKNSPKEEVPLLNLIKKQNRPSSM